MANNKNRRLEKNKNRRLEKNKNRRLEKNMKKLVVLLVTISLMLLGCINKDASIKNDNITNDNGSIKDNVNTKNVVNTGTDSNVNIVNGQSYKMSDSVSNYTSNSVSNNNWCTPGDKITVRGEEFTIVGTTIYKDRNVCQAEITRNNGKTTRYYSEDGSFESMISISSGSGANSKAVSVVNVNNS